MASRSSSTCSLMKSAISRRSLFKMRLPHIDVALLPVLLLLLLLLLPILALLVPLMLLA